MPPKLELPIKKLNLLIKCHDDKIKPLGTLIQKIFNTTDNSYGISKEVTYAIQNLKLIPLTNKELSKSNLKKTNDLIKTIKTLQQTTKGTSRQIGLTQSYQQLVEAIFKYAEKIECPALKPKINENLEESFLKSIKRLKALNDFINQQFTKGGVVCIDKDPNNQRCYNKIKDLINKVKEYKEVFYALGNDALVSSLKPDDLANTEEKLHFYKANIIRLKTFIQNYNRKVSDVYRFRMREGLNVFLNMEIAKIERIREEIKKRGKRGGSKHHKTKTTKKRIKGKQTRRNKVKNKTTIKAKNKTTIKAKNKTTIKAKNKTKKR